MSQFRQIVPNSSINEVNERYEYYLVWLSNAGGVRSWLFSHTEGSEAQDYELFTIEGLNDIRSVPMQERKEVSALTQSLESDELDYVKSIMSSNRVYQVLKNGTRIPLALNSGSVNRSNKNKEFEVSIRFTYKEENILNV
jgi:hypothetical protein